MKASVCEKCWYYGRVCHRKICLLMAASGGEKKE